MVGSRKVSTMAIVILLDALHEMVWLDEYVEKKGDAHQNKRVCLGWDRFDDSESVILIHVHMWN